MSMHDMAKHRYPFYIMFHPIDGYEELRWNKKGSLLIANTILVCWFIMSIVVWQMTGFIFNPNRPENFNILMMFTGTIVIFFLWVVANWSLCTLMEGEGRLADIWIASAYALLPYVLGSVPATIISNILTKDEGVFITYAMVLLKIWAFLLMTAGVKIVHQYTLKKTLITMGLTAVGIGIIIFLCILFFTLFQQVYIFLYTIASEMFFRLRL